MLKELKEKSRSWIVKALFALIVITFVSWGGYTNIRGCGKNVAIKIGRKIIYREEFEQMANMQIERTRNFYKMLYKMDLPKTQESSIRQYVIDNMITTELISQKADKEDIFVSKNEVKDKILTSEFFLDKATGKFDYTNYKKILAYHFGKSPSAYENEVKEEMIQSRLEDFIRDEAKASDYELKKMYRFENEKINLQYISIDPNSAKKEIKAEEEEIKAYFDKNKNEFKTDEQRKISYIEFNAYDYIENTKIREQDIENRFQESFATSMDPSLKEDRMRISYIELKYGKDNKRLVANQAQDLIDRIKSKNNFSGFAKEYSDHKSAYCGGDLGYITKSKFPKEASEIIFKMKKGELKSIEGSGVYNIVQVLDVIPAGDITMERLRNEIAYEIKLEKAEEIAKNETQRVSKEIDKDISQYAKEKGLIAKKMNFLDRDGLSKDFGFKVAEEIFKMKKNDRSQVLSDGFAKKGAYIIAEVSDILEPAIPPFSDVKEKVRQKYIEDQTKDYSGGLANKILDEIKMGEALEKTAKKYKVSLDETGMFSRSAGGYIPKIGREEELIKISFNLEKEDPLIKRVFNINNRYYIFSLKEKQAADLKDFESKKEKLLESIVKDKENVLVESWKDYLKKNTKIKRYI